MPHFPGDSAKKNPPVNVGHTGSIPGSGRSPGGRNGNPLQYSCLENPMDRGTWQATVHGVSQARILEWVAISSSRGSSWPRDQTHIFCITGEFFTTEPSGKLLFRLETANLKIANIMKAQLKKILYQVNVITKSTTGRQVLTVPSNEFSHRST